MAAAIGIAELAEAVSGFIEEVSEGLEGRQAFHARVARNALAIIAREVRMDPLPAELSFYAAATGKSAAEARQAFCTRIRSGAINIDDPDMLARISGFVAARLAVDNPKFSTLSRLKELDQ